MKNQKSKIAYLAMVAIAASMLLVVTACTDQAARPQGGIATPPQIHLTGSLVPNDLYGELLPLHRTGTGQLEVTIHLYDKRAHDLHVEYRYRFVDRTSINQVEETSGWHALQIPQNGYAEVKFASTTAQAADFDLEIRPAK